MKIDWSSLWKKEDWWAVWIGFVVLLFGIAKWLPKLPAIKKWTTLAQSLPNGAGTVGTVALLFLFILVLTLVSMALMGKATRKYVFGFLVIFGLSFLAIWVGKFASFTNWGMESVLWAVLLGLIISNIFKIPEWLKSAVQTEFFIKIGLVLLGAEILFSTIAKGGLVAMAQALLVVVVVWFAAFWIARRFGMNKDFAGIMASGVSICGVSAAIAAGGALKGSPKHVSYVISLVLLVAMPMIIFMPPLARAIGLAPNVAGAWMGGTIDTTAAVAAAGTLVSSDVGLQVASLVKMAQNVLIGFAAFFMAIWAAFMPHTGQGAASVASDKPRLIDIWYRLPKFILGFILASVIFSLVVEPSLGTKATSAVLGVTKGYREWFFALAFVSIGLDTRFKDLVAVGRGKPLAAFVAAQAFNIVWALVIVWLLWSGVLFTAPIK